MAFNWKHFIEEALALAPRIVTTVEQDKADEPHETKTQLAAQSLMQASTVAQTIDPNDAATTQDATVVAAGIISALKTPPPAPAGP
ncbi:MAG TPA: hypothetical protein VE178_03710 [Silvibacterium sp.]|jgi:hypothetical protein|nr:hypothetical protein [Silvibacterium sp.]